MIADSAIASLPLDAILLVAQTARQVISEHWGDSPQLPDMHMQCFRAMVLLDQAFKRLKVDYRCVTGHIMVRSMLDPQWQVYAGHHWGLVHMNEDQPPFLLDITLTQFAHRMDRPVPPIVWGLESDLYSLFGYRSDQRKFRYDRSYIDRKLLDAFLTRLGATLHDATDDA